MKLRRLGRGAGLLTILSIIWFAAGATGTAPTHRQGSEGNAQATSPQVPADFRTAQPFNPCNFGPPSSANPCTPAPGYGRSAFLRDVFRNRGAPAGGIVLVKETRWWKIKRGREAEKEAEEEAENAEMQQAEQPLNPCNPNGSQTPTNPCNPLQQQAAFASSGGKAVEWAQDYKTWTVVSGFVTSAAHGNRIVQTYIDPAEAAEVYQHNADLARLRKTRGYRTFPTGTRVVQVSWKRGEAGKPGEKGPVFLMRKEEPGYDSGSGDWHYGLARTDLSIIGEGRSGQVSICKECHAQARSRDYLFANQQ